MDDAQDTASIGTLPAPPQRDEIVGLPRDAILTRYETGVTHLPRDVLELDDAMLDTFFRVDSGVGRWSCRVLLGHLADAEIVCTLRMRRIAGEDHPTLPNWDVEGFIDRGIYAPMGDDASNDALPRPRPGGHVAVIHTMRIWNTEWLRARPADDWDRVGLHDRYGSLSLREMVGHVTWHFEHHAWFLAKKIDRLLARDA